MNRGNQAARKKISRSSKARSVAHRGKTKIEVRIRQPRYEKWNDVRLDLESLEAATREDVKKIKGLPHFEQFNQLIEAMGFNDAQRDKINTAFYLAALVHRKDVRQNEYYPIRRGKDEPVNLPYLTHPVAVSNGVMRVFRDAIARDPGNSQFIQQLAANGVVAALLHDTIEHGEVPFHCLTALFDKPTAQLVSHLTTPKILASNFRNQQPYCAKQVLLATEQRMVKCKRSGEHFVGEKHPRIFTPEQLTEPGTEIARFRTIYPHQAKRYPYSVSFKALEIHAPDYAETIKQDFYNRYVLQSSQVGWLVSLVKSLDSAQNNLTATKRQAAKYQIVRPLLEEAVRNGAYKNFAGRVLDKPDSFSFWSYLEDKVRADFPM